MNRLTTKGFTLIELLVVVAIIALLASILFPLLYRARERGRQASCLSNLCQMGKAFRMYADDHNGFAPRLYFGARWGGYISGDPVDPLYKYVNNSWKVYYCPTDPYRQFRTSPPRVDKPSNTSYGYNWWGPGNWAPAAGQKVIKVKLEDIPVRPTGLIVPRQLKNTVRDWSTIFKIYIIDEFGFPEYDGPINPDMDRNSDGVKDCYQRHGETGSNILFSDGHAYFVRGYNPDTGGGF